MACNPEVLKDVPLFALLDADEKAVLAAQVELRRFAARERIYKMGDPGGKAYVVVSGSARLTTVDEDHQEVVVDEPGSGESKIIRRWSSTSRGVASFSVLHRCSTRHRIRRMLLPSTKRSAWKWNGMTSKF